ncbi:hypothetical protein GSI_08990 [Ganoderma sinense ZZ0214-1]|uniref:Uncharacterized protein n=1 Tax=Ganoderma sinense ZZ0214-1 TaxID=1077348 RepID=A0A2G8S590_9APHY|nr:hypothetical protein GSI_08990 [Ganoderma sinense ZZ0214-1]
MLSRTLSVLQSLLFPWNERHHHATPAPPRPRQKRRSIAPTVPAFTKRKTSPVFDTGSPELSPSSFWQISSGPPGYGGPQPHKKRKTLPSLGPGSLELLSPFRRLFPSSSPISCISKKSPSGILHFPLAIFVRSAFQFSSVGVGQTSGARNGRIRQRPSVRMFDSEHAASLQYLLPSLSSLKKLSILAGRFPLRPLRYPILPSSSIPPSATLQGASIPRPSDPSGCSSLPASSTAPASTNPSAASEHGMSPTPLLSELRSLAIAYPDPEDRLFSLSLPNLRHLSLRDQPRVYHRLTADGLPIVDGPEGVTWPAPLLSPEECLSILRRMDLSLLTSFELVYMAHQPGEDDELLLYIAESLPRLEHLELHRYRGVRSQMRKTRVDHMHIAQLLSTLTSLVTLRLNLDFHDDHQAYCAAPWERERWFPLFKTRGFEIVDLLQASCPHLEHVALLYHGDPAATWAEFHPQRCAEPRFVLDYTKDHVDSEPCPREWVLLDDSVIPTLLTL